MKQFKSRLMALTVAVLLALTLSVPVMAADKATLQSNVTGTAAYMYKAVPNPQVGSIGGE